VSRLPLIITDIVEARKRAHIRRQHRISHKGTRVFYLQRAKGRKPTKSEVEMGNKKMTSALDFRTIAICVSQYALKQAAHWKGIESRGLWQP
jgi:hypothetical protein